MMRKNGQPGARLGLGLYLALVCGAGIANEARAETTEVRDFQVQVDGKPVGSNRLTIVDRDDGTTVVTNQADVTVKILITYTYSYLATEIYQGYQLLRLDGQCNDNFKKFTVQAALEDSRQTIRVRVNNNNEKAVPAAIWSSSYWKLPEAKYHNQNVTMLNADRGDVIQGQLQYVGTEQRPIAGQDLKVYHFRAAGGSYPIDLWYDSHHRLVRQEFVERGHRTVIELGKIQRSNK
jgi:hypothetical protein